MQSRASVSGGAACASCRVGVAADAFAVGAVGGGCCARRARAARGHVCRRRRAPWALCAAGAAGGGRCGWWLRPPRAIYRRAFACPGATTGLAEALALEQAVLVIGFGAAVDVELMRALFQNERHDGEDQDAGGKEDSDARAGAKKKGEDLVHYAVLLSCWNTWRNTVTSIYLHCAILHPCIRRGVWR